MSEFDKVLCLDKGGSGNDPMAMAAMMNGGMNGQWNNPFIYLVWMMFAQRMWGNGNGFGGENGQNLELQNQIQSLRNQMADNQNSNLLMDGIKGNMGAIRELSNNLNCDFNALQQCCCDVRCGIDKVAGQVGFSAERVINAVNAGDCNVITAIKDCCCGTQKEILRMQGAQQLQMCEQTHAINNGQRDIQVALDKGIASSAFQTQKQTCDIITAVNAAQQRTADLLNSHWHSETERQLSEAKFEISQLKQNQYLASIINPTAYSRNN